MKVTILGCGSSAGVPVIGCDCGVCRSSNPKNTRTRASIYIEINGLGLIVDTSPDFRQQMLRENITKIDAVLFTHDHADHTHGLDDIRSFNYLADDSIPIYGNQATIDLLQQRFTYALLPKPQSGIWFRPSLTAHVLPDAQTHEFSIKNTKITAFEQRHGKISTLGFRIGNFAYSTDVDTLPDVAFAALAGVDTWVVDCLRYTPSYSHSHLERTLEWIARVRPRRAILTHMAHEFDYAQLAAELPAGIVPGYDGMLLEMEDTQ